MKIKFSDIKISDSFASTMSREEKINECRKSFAENGILDRWIVVNYDNILIDGYILKAKSPLL